MMLVSTDTPRARRPRSSLPAAAALLAAAAVAGWWLGGVTRAPEPAATRTAGVTVGGARLVVAPGWSAVRAGTTATFAPVPGLAARALVAFGPAVDASLVPAALRGDLPDRLPAPRRATLAGRPAWAYGPMTDGERIVEVTVAPTTGDVLAVACSAPREAWSGAAGCAGDVRAAATTGEQAVAPAADLAFRGPAVAVLAALDRSRATGRRQLARHPAASARLARAHRVAATALAPFAADGGPAAAVAALRATAAAYARLGDARRDRDRARYAAARAGVVHGEAALSRALTRMR
jgi:hypothetical protein